MTLGLAPVTEQRVRGGGKLRHLGQQLDVGRRVVEVVVAHGQP
jgi:hypothetical protein